MREETVEQAFQAAERFLPLANDPERLDRLHREMGETCHHIRNRLHSVKLAIYLADQMEGLQQNGTASVQQSWSSLTASYRELEGLVESFHTLIRPLALRPSTVAVRAFFDELRREWEGRLKAEGIDIRWRAGEASTSTMALLDSRWMTVGLNGFLEWRLRALKPKTRVAFDWSETPQGVRVLWKEFPSSLRFSPRAPISSADETVSHCDSTAGSFSLALLARVVALHQGRLQIEGDDSAAEGFSLCIAWPKRWNCEASPLS